MLVQIEQKLPSLSRAERRVASWVLAHPRQAADGTLAEVARACGTSEPTVIRFCRHVGLNGFRELALRLTEALSRPVSYLHRDVSSDDTTGDAVAKVVDASIQSLVEMRSRLSSMAIEDVVDALAGARQIAFVGLGASGHVARDASHKFFRLGIPCTALTDTPSILQFSAITGPGDVLVVTSHSGQWRELINASNTATGQGATVIALTDPGTDLAAAATLVLPCQIHEDTSVYTPMSSRLAQLALLDAVHVSLALALGDTAVTNLRRAKTALANA